MTNVFFTLLILKCFLINCIHFIHFVLVPCVYLLNGGGQGTASWCRESVRVGSSPTMFYVLHYSLCSTFLGCNVFSDTRGIVPNGNGWNIGVLCWYHSLCCSFLNLLWTTTDPCFSFFYAKRVQLSPLFCMPNVFHQRLLEMNTPQ